MKDYLLTEATINWQGKTACSDDFSDTYWSREAAIAEKTHVFTDPMQVRWEKLKPGNVFTIGEIGFGFGLNFMLTAEKWKKNGFEGFLNYIAYENRPVSPSDIAILGRLMPQLPVSNLLKHYPLPLHGHHIIWFASNIKLILMFDDALNALKDTSAKIDAWYLDGFTPSKNTNIWNERVFSQMFRLSKPGATVSTYSAAGKVRRGLTNSGFRVGRKVGYGKKREMLFAAARGEWIPTNHIACKVAIVGRGIAGAYLYEALQRRSMDITIFDDGEATSSIVPQLAIYPSLAINNELRYRFSLSAFEYATQDNTYYHQTGIIFSPKNEKERDRWTKISAKFPDDFLFYRNNRVCFPSAGWLASRKLLEDTPATNQHIKKISWTSEGWLLTHKNGCFIADAVILANGAQISPISMPSIVDVIPGLVLSVHLKNPISQVTTGHSSIFPPLNNCSTVSGLYDRDLATVTEYHINELLGDIEISHEILSADIGYRSTTRDRLPLCGVVPSWSDPNEPDQAGLYLLQGLGSHGATTARLCAEYITTLITQEPSVLGISMQKALEPKRFLLRNSN
ncbi:MAG: tRNA (5-methylaminomethyl-2-thiouridine)(34)-methyltransferase MnmD [Candidatus Azotimanducaceae bacterium]|uniref:FAD-dependent oxidoreductase n=1 Tax=OM182 bacterium TaxID=2510334 RepID=A0A520S188_9GAMM|nr:hypothetical protein [Gammaproteobacteria bacterium]OUV68798.1 MAG: hypothetical protein CBC93_00255 [Gammaproteobacteria bacterium TMED133]RZO76235.1 MAG: FAD-dependent oxidoreductase [OM182 bacterium]